MSYLQTRLWEVVCIQDTQGLKVPCSVEKDQDRIDQVVLPSEGQRYLLPILFIERVLSCLCIFSQKQIWMFGVEVLGEIKSLMKRSECSPFDTLFKPELPWTGILVYHSEKIKILLCLREREEQKRMSTMTQGMKKPSANAFYLLYFISNKPDL